MLLRPPIRMCESPCAPGRDDLHKGFPGPNVVFQQKSLMSRARHCKVAACSKKRIEPSSKELGHNLARRGDHRHFHLERFQFQQCPLEIQATQMSITREKNLFAARAPSISGVRHQSTCSCADGIFPPASFQRSCAPLPSPLAAFFSRSQYGTRQPKRQSPGRRGH
ncbi:MAG: hypothetical protein QOJ40_626 [Verrucomicrobiota bacterium]